jgi:hypothetical protein
MNYQDPSKQAGSRDLNFYSSSYGARNPYDGNMGGNMGGNPNGPMQSHYAQNLSPNYANQQMHTNNSMKPHPNQGKLVPVDWKAAFTSGGFEGEPPLLEELDINFGHIRTKVARNHLFLQFFNIKLS